MAKKSMKEVQAELQKVTGVKRGEGEEVQSYLSRMVRKTAALEEEDWNKLSSDAQKWYNDAAQAMNDKEDIQDFGGDDEAEDKPAPRRRVAQDDDEQPKGPKEPEVGDTVIVTKADGEKMQGKVTEIDEKNLVLDVDGEEEILRRAKIKDIKVKGGGASKPETKAKEPEVGDTVELTLKDGEIVSGTLTELDEKNVVIEGKDGEDVYRRSKVEAIKVKAAPAKKTAKADDDEPAPKRKAAPADDEPPPKKPTTKKVDAEDKPKPATTAARELICQNIDASKDDIAKKLAKAGVEIKGSTLDITFGETHKTIALLKEFGLLKAA